jgi:hypothetical protein
MNPNTTTAQPDRDTAAKAGNRRAKPHPEKTSGDSEPGHGPAELPRGGKNVTQRWIFLLIGLATIYAVVRYHGFGGVDPGHFPLFILNKALSLAAVFLLTAAVLAPRFARGSAENPAETRSRANAFRSSAFCLAALHSLMSLILLSPEYYPKFFLETGRLNAVGELSMLGGTLSLACFTIAGLGSFLPENGLRRLAPRLGYLGILLTGLHVLVMGVEGWTAPARWHGALPPISLLAFLSVLVAVIRQSRLWRGDRT